MKRKRFQAKSKCGRYRPAPRRNLEDAIATHPADLVVLLGWRQVVMLLDGADVNRNRPEKGGRKKSSAACVQPVPSRRYYLVGFLMSGDANDTGELVRRAGGGDAQALAKLFAHYRDRLRH